MSSSATGLGSWKKGGRVSDASAVTQNIRVVAQGQADATYAGTQKKNPFRMSQAVLNGVAYGGQVLSLTNLENQPPVINIADIATYDDVNVRYVLNGNYTIAKSRILNIKSGVTLKIDNGQTLTNSGILNNDGLIVNDGTINNNNTFNNTSFINNNSPGIINNSGSGIINNSGIIGTTGTINNNSVFNNNNVFNSAPGTINNGGTINNNNTFNNTGFINNNSPGIINNIGTINNAPGGLYNNFDSTIINTGFIYTYSGGEFYNSTGGIIDNAGRISTGDGSSTCGFGLLYNDGTINNTGSGATNTNCPP